MELRIRLPGRSVAEDIALAAKGTELAIQRTRGFLAAQTLPAHSNNQCDDEGCDFLGEVTIEGVKWLMYLCAGEIAYYRP